MSDQPARLTAGVRRVLSPLPDVVTAYREQGWRVGVAPASGSVSVFYAEIARALDFPAWFGGNLDALWDCLTDLTDPTVLVLDEWTVLARARPERWGGILTVLKERAEIDPPFAVVLR